jgi:hypothetical protein
MVAVMDMLALMIVWMWASSHLTTRGIERRRISPKENFVIFLFVCLMYQNSKLEKALFGYMSNEGLATVRLFVKSHHHHHFVLNKIPN